MDEPKFFPYPAPVVSNRSLLTIEEAARREVELLALSRREHLIELVKGLASRPFGLAPGAPVTTPESLVGDAERLLDQVDRIVLWWARQQINPAQSAPPATPAP